MRKTFQQIEELIIRYPALSICVQDLCQLCLTLIQCFKNNGRLYICGNGGSAADALHITGELMKSFVRPRAVDYEFSKRLHNCFPASADELIAELQGALPAYPLVENISLATAFTNDANAGYIFSQQVYGYAREGDAVLGISTSGSALNVVRALMVARGRGATVLGLTGASGGKMKDICDTCICVPEAETYKVQELHLPVYHAICMVLENEFFGE